MQAKWDILAGHIVCNEGYQYQNSVHHDGTRVDGCDDATLTDCLEFFIAITAAMKKVLSPISETRIIPQDFKKPAARPPARKLVMCSTFQARR